jgi:hypothetical protein
MRNRLDVELTRHLKPVTAPEELWSKIPDELWSRIEAGQALPPANTRGRRILWACAAAAVVALCCLRVAPDRTGYPGMLDFRSSDPQQIRAWVEAHAGIDIPLVNGRSVQFIGAALLRGSRFVVCVPYRSGNQWGKLLVARGESGGPKHPLMRHLSDRGATVVAWVAGGQTYAIAAPVQRVACALCHLDRSS